MRAFPVHHPRVLTPPSARSGQLQSAAAPAADPPLSAHPRKWKRSVPSGGTRRRGAAVVEFAVVSPLLFVLVLGSIEFGRAFMSMELMNNAARTGCRKGVLSGSATKDVGAAVNSALANSAIPSASATTTVLVNGVQADASTAVRGDIITVSISIPFNTLSWLPSPLFLGGDTLSASVVMRRE